MAARQPRYSKEEHARRGTEVYERVVKPHVGFGQEGKIVALDVDSGTFEVGEDTVAAAQKLLARVPDAQVWCVRIGQPAVHRLSLAALV